MEIFGISSRKIFVVRNGLDSRFFRENKEDHLTIEKELKEKFKVGKKYILFVGTLEPIKNITRLLQAFQLFWQKRSDYQLVLVGKRGWLAGQYLQIAKDLGIVNQVKFLGYLEGEDLKKLLSQAGLFVMPSLYEGFGMSVLEAMASGAPCVISDLESLREIAEDAAEYFNPYDTEEMAEKMKLLLENEERRKELIVKGKKQARKFSWEKCARETLVVYQRINQGR
jgi:glycosyltransferase involved in cell wall biosynthesis